MKNQVMCKKLSIPFLKRVGPIFEISPFTLCQSMNMCIISEMIIIRFFALSCHKWLTIMLLRHGFSIPDKANDSKRSADKPKQTLKKKPNFL